MKRGKQAGYSIIEVLIAVAVTGFVLLTVVTLFYMGRRNVYSGKEMTYAVSVATRMLEDLSGMTAQDVRTNFKITDSSTLANVTVGTVTYANSVARDTTQAGNTTYDPQGFLTNWKNSIDGSKLANATAGIVVTPRNPSNANAPVTTAQATKIRVWVQWDEGKRRRTAVFDTTRIDRPIS